MTPTISVYNIAITNKRVDQLLLETSEGVAKTNLNLNKVDHQVGEIDHEVEILGESHRHYQEFLVADQQHQVSYNWEIQTLKVQCNGLVRTDGALSWELGWYWDLVLLQTQTINAQNGFIQSLEALVRELREIVMSAAGRTLGNLIIIEDDPVVVKEEPQVGLSMVTTLIKIED